ncbi:MAG TPA: Hsp20/alpha crystallin family protein [Planctomycetaceae bacterium]|nr:Hsp20/alpha crystallin family protein [Planctomycetaceae bacterium]
MPLFDDLTRLLQPFADPSAGDPVSSRWRPPADIYRTREGWLVKVELAGVGQEEVQVSASGNMLTVRGRRRDSALVEGGEHYSLEIAYSEFERRVKLPCCLDEARLIAECREGMLFVRVVTAGGAG